MLQADFPKFDRQVPTNGYCWWYIDAESDDQQERLTIIAFIGSVFSPYYKRARKTRAVDPLQHCSVNVVLYGKKNYWCMTERHRDDVQVESNHIAIGPSSLSYSATNENSGKLTIDVNEWTVPLPQRVKGQIVVDVQLQHDAQFNLDKKNCHQWWPAGPNSSISVNLEHPHKRWQGNAYVDMNQGKQPIENDLRYWSWSRFRLPSGTHIQYDVFNNKIETDTASNADPDKAISIHVANNGMVQQIEPSTLYSLDRTAWRMNRHARSDDSCPKITHVLENTPFYTRSAIRSSVGRSWVTGINESVSLAHFKKPIVQAMLRFRMPRLRWRGSLN